MDIELQTKALRTKAILNKINDTSYGYSQMSKRFPFNNATTNEELQKYIDSYQLLIDDLVNYLKTMNYGKPGVDKTT